ncbi:unnamed protein product [Staurois parvus]|uniref:Uncharacterized protein n=1 Tax=Staurois parvus TaxID=386267 RepID=A0ABN9EN98_9NEOB|nr:unnamed protein product [Staurois parvus]
MGTNERNCLYSTDGGTDGWACWALVGGIAGHWWVALLGGTAGH